MTVRLINNTVVLVSKHAFFLDIRIELLTYISCKTIVLWFCWTVRALHLTPEAPHNHDTYSNTTRVVTLKLTLVHTDVALYKMLRVQMVEPDG